MSHLTSTILFSVIFVLSVFQIVCAIMGKQQKERFHKCRFCRKSHDSMSHENIKGWDTTGDLP